MLGYNERGVVDPGADILRLFKYATTKIAISTSNHKHPYLLHTYRSKLLACQQYLAEQSSLLCSPSVTMKNDDT